jgi:hypothetical protein
MTTWTRHLYEHDPLAIAKGEVNGYSVLNVFGYQSSVGTSDICVWENAAPYVSPTSAVTMSVVSTSATDTGTAQVLISGLDANHDAITEVVTLNGTTSVTTTNAFLHINNVRLITAASGQLTNVGTITVTNNGTTYAKILPSIGQTQMSQYTVPNGYSFYLTRVNSYAQQNGKADNFNTYSVVVSNTSTSYTILQAPYFDIYEAMRVGPFKYAEKTSIQWRSRTHTSTSAVGMVIEGFLVKNTIQGEP